MSATAQDTRVLTRRQARLGVLDQANERHWAYGRCWCGAPHGGEAGVAFVPPPWDEKRDEERGW